MSVEEISFSDLMKECNRDNPNEFRRLLRRNGFHNISERRPIDKKTANTIRKTLIGLEIDWYKYKSQSRDQSSEGPLMHNPTSVPYDILDKGYRELVATKEESVENCLLGFVCNGSFLVGPGKTDFTLKVNPKVNCIIGDRGSGKSTSAKLLGLLSESVSEETDVLVKSILNLLKEKAGKTADISRRVRRTLKSYGIREYACLYVKSHITYCYYANFEELCFNILQLSEQEWKTVIDIDSATQLPMLILRQGEVTHIAEDPGQYYLNNILDALYPDLHDQRTKFAKKTQNIIIQFKNFLANEELDNEDTQNNKENRRRILNFIDKRRDELRSVKQGTAVDKFLYLLNEYRNNFNTFSMTDSNPKIVDLLEGDESCYYYMFIAPIIGFLARKIKEIEEAGFVEKNFMLQGSSFHNEESLDYFEPVDGHFQDKDKRDENNTDESIEEEIVTKDVFQATNRSLQQEIAQDVYDFLWRRLRVMEGYIKIFGFGQKSWSSSQKNLVSNFFHWDKSLDGLCKAYIKVVHAKLFLLKKQGEQCLLLMNAVNNGTDEIQIINQNESDLVDEYQKEIEKLKEAPLLYEKLIEATPYTRNQELRENSELYISAIRTLFSSLMRIQTSIEESQNDFRFNPIDIRLRQGNKYRDFSQLSFGQKSGVILKIVLNTIRKNTIILDQPEDNLDTHSVVNMLVPMLERLSDGHQIIVVTHDSNLVMGLRNTNVIILETLGEIGRVKLQGTLHNPQIVRGMMDVLEGGIGSFEQKIKVYEEFISQMKKFFGTDIISIESSLRQRTIDSLRSILQPVVNDQALLDFARHELKPSSSREDIIARVQSLQTQVRRRLLLPEIHIQRSHLSDVNTQSIMRNIIQEGKRVGSP